MIPVLIGIGAALAAGVGYALSRDDETSSGLSAAELAERARQTYRMRALEEKRQRIEQHFWTELARILHTRGSNVSLDTMRLNSKFDGIKEYVNAKFGNGQTIDDLSSSHIYNNSISTIKFIVDSAIDTQRSDLLFAIHKRRNIHSPNLASVDDSTAKPDLPTFDQLLPEREAERVRRSEMMAEIHRLQALRGAISDLECTVKA